jgi:LysM repeat protein
MYQVYKIMEDDTFDSVASKLGISSSELERINGFSDFDIGDMIVVPNNSNYYTYTVKPGDNLYNIAKKNNQNVDIIYAINGIKEGDYIYPGEKILIPRKEISTYLTEEGDTIEIISNKTSLPIEYLMEKNNNLELVPGQLIIYERD